MKKSYAWILTLLTLTSLSGAFSSQTISGSSNPSFPIFPKTSKEEIIPKLLEVGAIKFGDFTLKSGMKSPIYVDMRVLISHPDLLWKAATHMNLTVFQCQYQLICGVPMGAIPLATLMMGQSNKPSLLMRPSAKDHGTKKMVEGVFQKGDTVLVIEDVATTGGSILTTIETLEKEGLQVKDVVVFVNRQQGAVKMLAEKGYRLHSVFTMSEIVDFLEVKKTLDPRLLETVKEYLKVNIIE